MRHRAMFIYRGSLESFCDWFVDELDRKSLNPHKINNKHDIEIKANFEKKDFSYSIIKNSAINDQLCLYVKPKLKLFDALFGKKDITREMATNYSHIILSKSDKIEDLGWYLETEVWRGPTDTP